MQRSTFALAAVTACMFGILGSRARAGVPDRMTKVTHMRYMLFFMALLSLIAFGAANPGHNVASAAGTTTVTISGTGVVNGQPISFSADVVADVTNGKVNGHATISPDVGNFSAAGFIVVISCYGGARSFGIEEAGAKNILSLTDGNFDVLRTVEFADGSQVTLQGTSTRVGPSALTMNVTLNGTVNLPDLVGTEPIEEQLTQTSPGQVLGTATIRFQGAEGGVLEAVTNTTITAPALQLPGPEVVRQTHAFTRPAPGVVDFSYQGRVALVQAVGGILGLQADGSAPADAQGLSSGGDSARPAGVAGGAVAAALAVVAVGGWYVTRRWAR